MKTNIKAERADCPRCARSVSLTPRGFLRSHKDPLAAGTSRRGPCAGSTYTPTDAANHVRAEGCVPHQTPEPTRRSILRAQRKESSDPEGPTLPKGARWKDDAVILADGRRVMASLHPDQFIVSFVTGPLKGLRERQQSDVAIAGAAVLAKKWKPA